MFDAVFGAEMPLAVRFFLAFLIVLGMIGGAAWAVRRFGAGRLGGAALRGRQPRLAVIDYASVDGRRRLVLVRRDNVEHLLMIGGPTDVVIEPNIVRATAAPREVPSARTPTSLEALPRGIPLPETGNDGSWPLAPEPAAALRPRAEPLPDELTKPSPPAAEPRPQRDTLAALADELSARPAPARARPAVPRPQPEELEAKSETRETRDSRDARSVPRTGASPPPLPSTTVPLAPPPSPLELATTPDQSLADMAQRLEAALRKTPPEPRAPATPARPAAPEKVAEPRASKPEAKPARKSTLYDNLEQEMAILLGRPTKT